MERSAQWGRDVIRPSDLLFRAPEGTGHLGVADEARIRTLVGSRDDSDSLGYFATRRDRSVIWDTGDAATATAGISYRVVGSVCVATGDPLGDPERWSDAVAAWRARATSEGWSQSVIGAGERARATFTQEGLAPREAGDEAVVDLRGFSLNGPGLTGVRQAVHGLRKHGWTTQVRRHGDVDRAHLDELAGCAAAWAEAGGDERVFPAALGRLGDPLDADCLLVEAADPDGVLRGFLSLVPWGANGATLDLVRRDPSAEPGVFELLVVALAEAGPANGIARASLNVALFREAFESGADGGALAQLWRPALALAMRDWQPESTYRMHARFLPEWRPRYVLLQDPADLAQVGAAAGSAEGFHARPTLSEMLARGRSAAAGDPARAGQAPTRAAPAPEADLLADMLSAEGLTEQELVRREKLARLREQGIDPYPVTYPRTHSLAQVRAEAGDLPPDTRTGRTAAVAGRIILERDSGKLCFATLRDGTGDLQVMLSLNAVGREALEHWKRDIDLGDHVGVTGEVITSRRGELSLLAESFRITSKSLRPLPEKYHGLTDPEARVRARYVDLIVRPEARDIAHLRSTVVRSVRSSLEERGFVEVETPILQLVHGGANARPFQTHINAYDLDLTLRIATELHLKRLVVGGMEKVFEIGRQFRNEGADFKHNPEFTALEVYESYGDYDTMRLLTQSIIQEAATAVYGAPVARHSDAEGNVTEYDLSGDWPVRTMFQAVSAALGEEISADTPIEQLHRHAEAIGLEHDPDASWSLLIEEIYEELCEATTTTPVFFKDFPKEGAPLTRQHRSDPRLAEKWDLVIFGAEQGTAYSELVDPLDQRERLVAQSLLAAAGNPEAMQLDEDFLRALEYGMPPTGGMGMGIDRLVMNLTGLGIRDTILFPLVKPER